MRTSVSASADRRLGAVAERGGVEMAIMLDLDLEPRVTLGDGLVLLRDFAALPDFASDLAAIAASAPFRCMMTPGGKPMRVEMSNCGAYGWIADRSGYRYSPSDPVGGAAWPAIPAAWCELAVRAAREAGFAFEPDACLINRYAPGVGMGAHRDTDERDARHPIVTVSFGATATFFYGLQRTGLRRIAVRDRDVLIMGGAHRDDYHGIAPLSRKSAEPRISLTFRRAV